MVHTQEELTKALFTIMGKVVLVTGAAGGIGSAVALKLAESGYDIVLNYHSSEKKALLLAEKIREDYQVRCIALQADVSLEAEVDRMFTEAEEKLGGVDILINNAAIDLPEFFQKKNADDFRRVLEVNVIGAYNCARRAYGQMCEKQAGKIVNIASTNGINSYYPVNMDYDASKAALISLTHNLAVQFAPYVNVNAVAPGFIGTEKELEGYDEAFLKEETDKILLKRYGRAEEVADLVRFLISEEAAYINNSVIRIDGGQMGSV